MGEEFGVKLVPTSLTLPVTTITNTRHSAWWVKPVAFLGGAATVYFINEKNSTGALIAGGAATLVIFIDF
jgi:hypothetical protein